MKQCCCNHQYSEHSTRVYFKATHDEATAGVCMADITIWELCECIGFLRESYRTEWLSQQVAFSLNPDRTLS
jgi:hypothetical protein